MLLSPFAATDHHPIMVRYPDAVQAKHARGVDAKIPQKKCQRAPVPKPPGRRRTEKRQGILDSHPDLICIEIGGLNPVEDVFASSPIKSVTVTVPSRLRWNEKLVDAPS